MTEWDKLFQPISCNRFARAHKACLPVLLMCTWNVENSNKKRVARSTSTLSDWFTSQICFDVVTTTPLQRNKNTETQTVLSILFNLLHKSMSISNSFERRVVQHAIGLVIRSVMAHIVQHTTRCVPYLPVIWSDPSLLHRPFNGKWTNFRILCSTNIERLPMAGYWIGPLNQFNHFYGGNLHSVRLFNSKISGIRFWRNSVVRKRNLHTFQTSTRSVCKSVGSELFKFENTISLTN